MKWSGKNATNHTAFRNGGKMLFKKLIRTALNYKAQFISMIIMVGIGMGVFMGFNMEWYSLEQNLEKFVEETKYADYRIYSEEGFPEDFNGRNMENKNYGPHLSDSSVPLPRSSHG